MDDQLKAIIEKIKLDGVKNANNQSADIINQAKQEASAIIKNAENEKAAILKQAEIDADNIKASGHAAVAQSGRDVVLSVRKKLTALFDNVLKSKISKNNDEVLIKECITTVIKNWSSTEEKSLNILLPEKLLVSLNDSLKKELGKEITQGLNIIDNPDLKDGFRITEKEGSFYYDFTTAGITELMSEYLTEQFSNDLKSAESED